MLAKYQLKKLWEESLCDYTLINDNGCAIVDIFDDDGEEIETPLLTLNEEQYTAYKSGRKSFIDAMYDYNKSQCEVVVLIAYGYAKAKEMLADGWEKEVQDGD